MTDDEREESLHRTRAAWAKVEARHAESDKLGVPPLRKFARVWPPGARRIGRIIQEAQRHARLREAEREWDRRAR
jgi:hypothetical protein